MNKDLIKAKLEFIINALEVLRRAIKKAEESSPDTDLYLFAAEKKAEEIVESAISINQEILFGGNKVGKNYYDTFIDLKSLNIFSESELIKFAKSAGFRNRLAHEYMDVDEHIVLNSMEGLLKIYPNYVKKILEWLQTQ